MAKHTKTRQTWSPEQEKIVRDNYPDSTPQQMNGLLNGVFTTCQISHKAKKIGIRKSNAYKEKYGLNHEGRFLPASRAWNKGIAFDAPGRAAETRFKPGLVPPNHKPAGSMRVTFDGYVQIKIEEGMHKWRLLHREIWKQHHGGYPPPGTVLIFKDGNQQNCDISNLELITRKKLMQRNSIHNYPKSVKEVMRLKGVITRRINGR